jgi:hypothetical protein
VKLHFTIDPDWYIYANPVKNESLEPNATTVRLKGVKPSDVTVTYPEGKLKKDKDLGNYRYYDETVTVEAAVRNATGPLEFFVQVNACTTNKCLLPGQIKLNVP